MTISAPAGGRPNLPGRRYDHPFFLVMVVLLVAVVFIGFAPTYYLAGVFRAPLPSLIVQIHAAVFTCWLLMLLVQVGLVSGKRVDLHKKLGMAGFGLAALMVVMGMLIFADVLARNHPADHADALYFDVIVPFMDALNFGVLAGFAFGLRKNAAAHKRLILIASAGITGAAFFRWHVGFLYHQAYRAYLMSYLFLLVLVVYDLWSTHKVQRATLWGSVYLIVMEHFCLIVVGPTAAWQGFARWVQTLNI